MAHDILYREDTFVFSYRVAGLLYHKGSLLLQRPPQDDYALIGGHVARGETSAEALIREYREELHAEIAVDRLMAVGEIFFPWGKRACHQIGLYYIVHLNGPSAIPMTGTFHGYDDLGGERVDIEFCWVPVEKLQSVKVYPLELTPHLVHPPEHPVHFITREIDAERFEEE